jgi:hypothetical protein
MVPLDGGNVKFKEFKPPYVSMFIYLAFPTRKIKIAIFVILIILAAYMIQFHNDELIKLAPSYCEKTHFQE